MKFSAFSLIALSSILVGAFSAPSESIQQRDVFIPKFEIHCSGRRPQSYKFLFDDLLAEVKRS